MFDGDGGDFVKFLEQLQSGISVNDIVEGQLLPLQLSSIGNAWFVDGALSIESSGLMRILTIAQVLRFLVLQMQGFTEGLPLVVGVETAQIISNGGVIARRQLKSLFCKREFLFSSQRAIFLERRQYGWVIVGIDYHSNVGMILGGSPEQ